MTYFAVLLVKHEGCPFTEVSQRFPDVEAYAFSQQRLPDGKTKFLIKCTGNDKDRKKYFRAFKAHPLTVSLELISETKEASVMSAVVDYSKIKGNIMSTVEAADVHFSEMVTHKEGSEEWVIYAKDESVIDTVIKSLEASGCNVKMVQTHPIESWEDSTLRMVLKEDLNSLTAKQKYIFKVAYSMGYYDGKRKVSLDQIAKELGVSKPAVWRHIQNIEEKIMKIVSELV